MFAIFALVYCVGLGCCLHLLSDVLSMCHVGCFIRNRAMTTYLKFVAVDKKHNIRDLWGKVRVGCGAGSASEGGHTC